MDKEPTLGQTAADKVSGMSSIYAQTVGSKDQDAQDDQGQLTVEERRASVRHACSIFMGAIHCVFGTAAWSVMVSFRANKQRSLMLLAAAHQMLLGYCWRVC